MELSGKIAVVTGGGSGIGKALSEQLAGAGAKVVVADLNQEAAEAVAKAINGLGLRCDVTRETDLQALVKQTEAQLGPIDLFCSNAGLAFSDGGDQATSAPNSAWQTCWDIHVMAHVYAARAVLPSMIERGGGYFLQTVSAAGLLSQIGDAAYSTTKHAAVGFAESLAITHGDQGIRVSILCPQYVATPLIGMSDATDLAEQPGVKRPEDVARAALEAIEAERFLVLPHPEVHGYWQNKVNDYDRWIGGMRKLRRSFDQDTPHYQKGRFAP